MKLMERIGFNFKRIRKLKGLTQESCAELADVTKGYIGQIESGKSKSFGRDAQTKWALIFDVDVGEFTRQPEEYEQERGIPVIAHISAGGGIIPTSPDQYPVGEGLEYLDLPPGYSQDRASKEGIYGLIVKGDSMLPLLRDGSRLYIKPNNGYRNGDYVIFRDSEGLAWVKEIELADDDTIIFRSVGVGPTIIKKKNEIDRLEKVWLIER